MAPPRFINTVVLSLLRSRLGKGMSRRLLALTVTGKKTGKPFTFPVMYAKHESDFVIVAADAKSKRWWKNLDPDGAEVTLTRGTTVTRAFARTLERDPRARGKALRVYITTHASAAKPLGIPSNWPTLDDENLGKTAESAVVVRATPA